MISVRRAESDADLEAWLQARIEVLPNERAASVEEMRLGYVTRSVAIRVRGSLPLPR